MNSKNFEEMQKSSNLWAESGYSYDTSVQHTVSNNTPTMISMSNEPMVVSISHGEITQKNNTENNALNKE
jgi:hypothetical protein